MKQKSIILVASLVLSTGAFAAKRTVKFAPTLSVTATCSCPADYTLVSNSGFTFSANKQSGTLALTSAELSKGFEAGCDHAHQAVDYGTVSCANVPIPSDTPSYSASFLGSSSISVGGSTVSLSANYSRGPSSGISVGFAAANGKGGVDECVISYNEVVPFPESFINNIKNAPAGTVKTSSGGILRSSEIDGIISQLKAKNDQAHSKYVKETNALTVAKGCETLSTKPANCTAANHCSIVRKTVSKGVDRCQAVYGAADSAASCSLGAVSASATAALQ